MITVKARINISGNRNGKITSVSFSPSGTNISARGASLIDKNNAPLGNPFILGKSVLGKGDKYVKEVPYYFGNILSDKNGNFNETYKMTVSGNDLSAIVLVFNKEKNYHPMTVTADGNILSDDDTEFEIGLSESINSHEIQISNWNAPNEPLIITGIYADINIDIDESNLVSFNSDISDRANKEKPSYGIFSNSGSLTFLDFNQRALDLINAKILHSGIKVYAWLENEEVHALSPDKGIEQICEMEIRDLDYENNNRQVQLTLKDNLEDWQHIDVPFLHMYQQAGSSQSKTAQEYYQRLYDATKSVGNYDLLSFDELDAKTQEVLRTTIVKYSILEGDNLWENWNKLCELCLLHIYVNNNNRIVTRYSE